MEGKEGRKNGGIEKEKEGRLIPRLNEHENCCSGNLRRIIMSFSILNKGYGKPQSGNMFWFG